MRHNLAIAVLLMAGLVLPVAAQQITPQNALTGVNPRGPLKMVKVDTSRALAPTNIANSFRPPRPPTTFTLSRVFPKITVAPWPLKLPSLFHRNNLTPTPLNPQAAFPKSK